jgi:hypothetical protein
VRRKSRFPPSPLRRAESSKRRRQLRTSRRSTARSLFPVAVALIVVLAAAFALSSLRDDRSTRPIPPGLIAPDPGPIHVHGLGINPKDGSLFIATHTGMWRVGKSETTAKRVTARSQDTMGFSVVGPDRFIGSGHPDVREARERDLPPLLGLIESNDAGQNRQSVSLLGKADFHVLRSVGARVYGFDATNNRLLVSGNGGRNWKQQAPPGALVDLVPSPIRPAHLIASSDMGLHESKDAGRTWRLLADGAGLLAWPRPERLYLLSGGGQIFLSRDAGKQWRQVGILGGEPAAFLARSEHELFAALHDGTIKRSTDGGTSWTVRSRPAGAQK